MIEYRTIKTQEDALKAKQLCDKNGLEFPYPNEIMFGAFDGNEIVGFSALKKVYQIEPIINSTIHGHVTSVLMEKVLASASIHTNEVTGLVSRKEHLDLYKKVGFKILEESTPIKKSV